jgi:hypothetical protein
MKPPPIDSRSPRGLARLGGAALVTLLLTIGCGVDAGLPEAVEDAAFVPIYKDSHAKLAGEPGRVGAHALPALADAAGAEGDFYLAIRKSELDKKWLLSGFLRNVFPGGTIGGAGQFIATRVVKLHVQNGSLIVIDARDHRATSDLFAANIVHESYPIVTGTALANLRGAENYIVIDPANDRNRFGLLGDYFAAGAYGRPDRFHVQVAYSSDFRKLDDGIRFTQVVAGYRGNPIPSSATLAEPNQFRSTATAVVALRAYHETPGFEVAHNPVNAKTEQEIELFFKGERHLALHEDKPTSPALHWAVSKGMKPIEMRIDPRSANALGDKDLTYLDVVAAIQRGAQAWNAVFGYPVFVAEVARPDEAYGDPDKNFIQWSVGQRGTVTAQGQHNPNTGEMLGANIILDARLLHTFASDPDSPESIARMKKMAEAKAKAKAKPKATKKASDDDPSILIAPESTLCQMPVAELETAALTLAQPAATGRMPSHKEHVERLITEVVMHEMGHVLGLRHNFRGSLSTPISSVMDYLLARDAVTMTEPGPYDLAAVRYLYGLSTVVPQQPFCTDSDLGQSDPDCQLFDTSPDPLETMYLADYKTYDGIFTDGKAHNIFEIFLALSEFESSIKHVLDYVRPASVPAAVRWKAWDGLVHRYRAPMTTDFILSNDNIMGQSNYVLGRSLQLLYLSDEKDRGPDGSTDFTKHYVSDPPATDAAFIADVIDQTHKLLINADGVRTTPVRRIAIAVLKKLQTDAALKVLVDSRTELVMRADKQKPSPRIETEEIIRQIDVALTPYYK